MAVQTLHELNVFRVDDNYGVVAAVGEQSVSAPRIKINLLAIKRP